MCFCCVVRAQDRDVTNGALIILLTKVRLAITLCSTDRLNEHLFERTLTYVRGIQFPIARDNNNRSQIENSESHDTRVVSVHSGLVPYVNLCFCES